MTKLEKLFLEFDSCPLCKATGNKLQHILGGGKLSNPKVALVFINPTHTNISSDSNWNGNHFPFIGVTHFWQILSGAGWVTKKVIENISKNGWNENEAAHLEKNLVKRGIYITNLVKCTFQHGDYPERNYFEYHLPLFKRELEIVKPEAIITFGVLTIKHLTGKNLVLKNYFDNPQPLAYSRISVYPCYFPVGRGNPRLATQILRKLRFLLE